VIGLCLFLTVLLSNFTGYLLPWDQLAFWAITICTGMLEYIPGVGMGFQTLLRGGSEVGPATLGNFYAIHTAVLPLILVILMLFHFWRVRKAGGLVIPVEPGEVKTDSVQRVPAIPNLILREVVVALVLTAVIIWISIFFDAPLGDPANPGLSPNPTKAPWYFMGFQEILLHFHPLITLCLLPLLIIITLTAIPYIDYPSVRVGVWFTSIKGRRMAIESASGAFIAASLGIVLDEYVIDFTAWIPTVSTAISNGLLPLSIFMAVFYGWLLFIKRRYAAGRYETIQSTVVFFLTLFIIFTVVGTWFRGPGMRLVWPQIGG
jgi:quinol-cytochrome oxidoreductase complex cytochrome b subunit